MMSEMEKRYNILNLNPPWLEMKDRQRHKSWVSNLR